MDTEKSYRIAWILALFTIGYNIVEGLLSVFFGFQDESLVLFGFGVDSFIEVLSGIGIAHMIVRVRNNPGQNRDEFERNALRITGLSFYILVIGLVLTALYNVWTRHNPKTTFWGIVISLLSIVIMMLVVYGKRKVGKQLGSEAILSDAECTRVCIYMSIVLLVSSVIYEWSKIPYLDSLGTLGLAYFSFREGRECFEKARSDKYCTCGHH